MTGTQVLAALGLARQMQELERKLTPIMYIADVSPYSLKHVMSVGHDLSQIVAYLNDAAGTIEDAYPAPRCQECKQILGRGTDWNLYTCPVCENVYEVDAQFTYKDVTPR